MKHWSKASHLALEAAATRRAVPTLWVIVAYLAVVVLTLWLGNVLPAPHPSSHGWSD